MDETTKCGNCRTEEILLADSGDRIGKVTIHNYGLSPAGAKRILLKKCPTCGKLSFYLK